MLKKNTISFLLFIAILISLSSIENYGQGRGKISGKVIDKSTGEPLIGVNIFLKGTTLGAASDIDGSFYIIGIPAGSYTVQASFIGFHQITIEAVLVRTDLTTQIDIELEQTSIETPTIIVQAQQTLVQRDITATRKTVTRESIEDLPGLETTADVFRLQGGTTVSNVPQSLSMGTGEQLQIRDESVKDIHVRGGRGGEILFLVDGVPVTHPIYGGRDVLDLNVVTVEQVELLTGAFSAEYGQAQSGVVNITTRSGGEKFKGGIEYKTDELGLFGAKYNTHFGSIYLSGPEPITSSLLPWLGIDIPGKINFFFSISGNLTNTAYNNNRIREDYDFFGIKIKEKQDNTQNLNAKLNWDITNSFRTAVSFNGSWKDWSVFDYGWINVPDNLAKNSRDNVNINLLVNHVLSQKSFYSLNFGYLGIGYHSSLNGKSPRDFWVINDDTLYSTISVPTSDPLTGFLDTNSYNAIWRDDNTSTFIAKGDFTSQFHPDHLVKIGFEGQFHDISYVDIQDGGYKLSQYGEYVFNNGIETPPPPGPFKEFGRLRWVFDVKPAVGGFYIQEKFEKEFLILNAGLRVDAFWMGNTINDEQWKTQWKKATGLEPDWKTYKFKFSPRFGISFPILEQTVIFFSYGHFNQLPELQYFYRDPYSGGFTGNPGLDYEQTILYEFGFTHQLFDDIAIDIKSYAKDISEQVGTTQLLAAFGTPVSLYDNIGYSRARGLEFEVTKGYSNHTSGKVSYTVQWADGYSSSAFEDYIRSTNDFPKPIRERRLGWDVRHQIVFQATLSSPKGSPISIFGLELPDDWNLTILSNINSGYPYTPGTNDPFERQVKENINSGPLTTTTDLKFIKSFNLFGVDLSLTIDVFNLFDQNNIVIDNPYYGWFNNWTGKPFVYGDLVAPTTQFYDWYTMVRKRDPRQYTTGRYAKLGFRIDF